MTTYSEYYNRNKVDSGEWIGCYFTDDDGENKFKVFDNDGNFICVTDCEGAHNVCEVIDRN